MKALIKVLATPEDRERLQGVLDQLCGKGVRITEAKGILGKNDIVLAVLSEYFYENEELKSQLFNQLAVGADNILPLKLGDDPVPEEIMNVLFARNIIMASGRSDEQLVERILSAIPKKKNNMPVVLAVAAVVLLLLGGIFLWRSMDQPEEKAEIAVEEPIPNPLGITEEELAKIQDVVIIGDSFTYYSYDDIQDTGHWPEIYDFAYEVWEEDGSHWYSTEDGHEFAMTRYDDLRFLELMPNLSQIQMVLVEVDSDKLPDLSGSKYLSNVRIRNCSMTDIDWISGSSVNSVDICGTNIADYGSLSKCKDLRYATIDGQGKFSGDVSNFAPPAIQELYLYGIQSEVTNLSALSECEYISSLRLDGLQIQDLDFLRNMHSLYKLELNNLPQLRDISGVSAIKELKELYIWQCDQIYDYMPINECSNLESLHIDRWNWTWVDSSFLNGLTKLYNVGLFGLNLNNMDFLETVNQNYGFNLGFCGDIEDYSGLAYVDHYRWIHVNPRSNNGMYGDFSLVEPYLQNASIDEMELYNCTNVDLESIPEVNSKLIINRGDLENLEGLHSDHMYRLELRDMQYLRSLEGIQGLSRLERSYIDLSIFGCPRLTDYSTLNGATLGTLNFTGTYTLPDFSGFAVEALRLESIEDLEDLSCLETLDKEARYHFEFLGLDNLKDLSILRNFQGGSLYVPPQVAEQAEELVADGNFISYEVRYPDSGWDPLNEEVTLLSFEELETLPKSVLRRVSRVWIAGDEIIDPNRYEVWEEWEYDHSIPVLYDRQTGETRKIETGSITDFSLLSNLTNLWELRIFAQPITDLEGIQNLSNLACFEARFCPDLLDTSALYTLQSLEEISLQDTGVHSIQGVQNLPRLRHLNVCNTEVTNLFTLMDCDFTFATEVGGFTLIACNDRIEDFSPLATIPAFQHLNICGVEPENWMKYVERKPVKQIVGRMGDDATLRLFVEQHPELEEMHIEDGYHLTDLTPLLDLENLYYVHVWDNAEPAGHSLDGLERRFQLDID